MVGFLAATDGRMTATSTSSGSRQQARPAPCRSDPWAGCPTKPPPPTRRPAASTRPRTPATRRSTATSPLTAPIWLPAACSSSCTVSPPDGEIFPFAQNNVIQPAADMTARGYTGSGDFTGAEWCGATFEPKNGNWLFGNIQSPASASPSPGPGARAPCRTARDTERRGTTTTTRATTSTTAVSRSRTSVPASTGTTR